MTSTNDNDDGEFPAYDIFIENDDEYYSDYDDTDDQYNYDQYNDQYVDDFVFDREVKDKQAETNQRIDILDGHTKLKQLLSNLEKIRLNSYLSKRNDYTKLKEEYITCCDNLGSKIIVGDKTANLLNVPIIQLVVTSIDEIIVDIDNKIEEYELNDKLKKQLEKEKANVDPWDKELQENKTASAVLDKELDNFPYSDQFIKGYVDTNTTKHQSTEFLERDQIDKDKTMKSSEQRQKDILYAYLKLNDILRDLNKLKSTYIYKKQYDELRKQYCNYYEYLYKTNLLKVECIQSIVSSITNTIAEMNNMVENFELDPKFIKEKKSINSAVNTDIKKSLPVKSQQYELEHYRQQYNKPNQSFVDEEEDDEVVVHVKSKSKSNHRNKIDDIFDMDDV